MSTQSVETLHNFVGGKWTASQASEFVTAAHPTRTGTAPAAPPMTMFWVEVRFSHSV